MFDLKSDYYVFLNTDHALSDKPGHYNFVLPKPLQFDVNQNWECGVKKIILPTNIANNTNCLLLVHDFTDHSITSFQVGEKPNRYKEKEFETELNDVYSKGHFAGKFQFSYANVQKKFSLAISNDLIGISFNSTLAAKLGFQPDHIYQGVKKWSGLYIRQLSFGCLTLSIFSNLVHASIFGNEEDYIMETVSIPAIETDLSYHTFEMKPNYMKVGQSYVENILVNMSHEDRSPVQWFGTTVECPVTIVLHFRRGIIV